MLHHGPDGLTYLFSSDQKWHWEQNPVAGLLNVRKWKAKTSTAHLWGACIHGLTYKAFKAPALAVWLPSVSSDGISGQGGVENGSFNRPSIKWQDMYHYWPWPAQCPDPLTRQRMGLMALQKRACWLNLTTLNQGDGEPPKDPSNINRPWGYAFSQAKMPSTEELTWERGQRNSLAPFFLVSQHKGVCETPEVAVGQFRRRPSIWPCT